jgi:hypothetical protein
MLASLLPGLRDLRAPLAAGYLWLVAGWLYFAPQLPVSVNDAQGVLKDIYRVVDVSGPVAIAAGLTFAAYMVGILSTGLLSRPMRAITTGVPVVLLYLLALPVVLLAGVLPGRWHQYTNRIYDAVGERESGAIVPWMGKRLMFPGDRVEKLVVRRIGANVLREELYRDRLMVRLTANNLIEFMRMIGYPAFKHPDSSTPEEIRNRVLRYLDSLQQVAAGALVRCVVQVEHHARDIIDELHLIPERMVGDKPIYERWDRLRAEGEFRQAVVPPIVATIAVLVARGVFSWPYGLVLGVVPLVIQIQGIGKEHAAQAQLLQTLEADVIQADSIERLRTGDLHWRPTGYPPPPPLRRWWQAVQISGRR